MLRKMQVPIQKISQHIFEMVHQTRISQVLQLFVSGKHATFHAGTDTKDISAYF